MSTRSISFTSADVLAIAITGLILLLYLRKDFRKLPPGPSPLPVIGNRHQIPHIKPWETYSQWQRDYGDIIYLRDFGRPMIILNSLKVVRDLFEQRSTIYSSRPQRVMADELMTFNLSTTFRPYGNAWRKHRTLYSRQLNPAVLPQFHPLQYRAVTKLLRALMADPTEYAKHIKHLAGSIVLGFAYGYTLDPKNDSFIAISDRVNGFFARAQKPGEFLVDALPFLKYLPEWMPGAGFQTVAREARNSLTELRDHLFTGVKEQIAAGTAGPSFVANSLSELGTEDETNPDIVDVKLVAAGFFSAGTDTSSRTLLWFILAMVLYPNVARKAQHELDSVIGPNRLPNFNDRSSLPYVDAVVKEVLRWYPVIPTGLPHASVEEDVYCGYRIPKGSTVIPNIWAILHDEDIYPDSSVFRPERFMPDNSGRTQPDPALVGSFGYGRRVCPGRALADTTVWLTIASILTVFDITNAIDETGNEIDVNFATEPSGIGLCQPQTFPCRFVPRSKGMLALVESLDI